MTEQGLDFIREQEMPLFYKDKQIGERRVDFLIQNKILLELKASAHLEALHIAQAVNYLEAFKLEVGLLINFGSEKLGIKRLMKNEYQLRKGNQIGFTKYNT